MKKKLILYIGIVLAFLVLSYGFVPQVLGGKIVNQSDISGYVGMSHEMSQWNSTHPSDPAHWTGSMFGGMPTTTISAPKQGDFTQPLYNLLLLGKRPATYLFIALLGAFLLLLSLGIDTLIAAGGAVASAFCAYNLQIIQVGHNTKMQALAFLPWALAAVIFTYRSIRDDKKYLSKVLLGASLFALALSFQIKANHQQITYYLAIMIFIYAISVFVGLLKRHEGKAMLGRFFVASAALLVLGLGGIATNANKLIPIYKYTPQSMRGGSELVQKDAAGSAGLSVDYATAWSYGWEELPNLMIPNFNGGSSAGAVKPAKSATYKLLRDAGQKNLSQVTSNLPLYWGPQPFTAGPMYMGAITVFLFLLGLMICEAKDRWWILTATIIAILLGLGSHFMWFTKLWYDYAPFYNKFRTVSMALVVLQFTLPMLGFLALDRIVKGAADKTTFKKKGAIAFGLTAGFCLLCVIMPGIAGTFSGASDASMQDILVDALVKDRKMLLVNDALRSLIFISASFALLWWGYSVPSSAQQSFASHPELGRARRRTAAVLVCLLVLVDVFAVGKRYLRAGDFVSPRDFNSQFKARPVDEMILEDKDPSYRVLDLTVNIFNDSHPSYWHKNIGGYSPAKLQRYQDVIEMYLTDEINQVYKAVNGAQTLQELEDAIPELPVLSALNCRYLILGSELPPAVNKHAFGAAWFVNALPAAATPQEKISSLARVSEDRSEAGEIEMTYYSPDELHYHYVLPEKATAVFSEVYYPEGWHAWIADTGEEIDVNEAYWILRSADLPAGEHELIMRYDPQSISMSATVSRVASLMVLLILLLSIIWMFVQRKR